MKRKSKYSIFVGDTKVERAFESYAEAEKWAMWNFKGNRGAFEIKIGPRIIGRGSKFTLSDFQQIKELEAEGIDDVGIALITGWSIYTIKGYLKYKESPSYLK